MWKELWPITVCQFLGNRLFFWGIKSQWTRRAIHIMLKGIGVLIYRKWLSKWLLFNARSANFKLYHGENKLIFNETMMRSALYYTNTLSWIFIVPAHWNNSPRLDTSSHSDILPRGGSRREGAPGARPLKLEKIWFFGVKSWFFTRNTPTIFAPPSAIGKNMIFWRKIVIFHTKYPKNVRASLRPWSGMCSWLPTCRVNCWCP